MSTEQDPVQRANVGHVKMQGLKATALSESKLAIERASIPFESKHRIILPATSPISRLILIDSHMFVGHRGKNSILVKVRQRF